MLFGKPFNCFQIIAFDELKTDYKNPIDQCNSLNPLVLPEYFLHAVSKTHDSDDAYWAPGRFFDGRFFDGRFFDGHFFDQ